MKKITLKYTFLLFLFFALHVNAQKKEQVCYPLGSFSLDANTKWIENAFDTKISDSVKLVGLGEVVHGGKETTEFKAKMVQYLVEKRGYRLFLFEYPNAALSLLNYYFQEKSLQTRIR